MRLPALRAAARVAWRGARRAPGRSALVVLMVALPVAGLSFGLVAIRTAVREPIDRVHQMMGSADLVVYRDRGVARGRILEILPPGSSVVEIRWAEGETTLEGSFRQFFLREPSIPADRDPVAPMFAFLEGRAPQRAGEAAIPPELFRDLGITLGGELNLEELGLRVRVTGTVVDPEQLAFPIAVLGPGTLPTDREDIRGTALAGLRVERFLIRFPAGSPREALTHARDRLGPSAMTRADALAMSRSDADETIVSGFAFSAAAVGLLVTGLIAGAAFAVGARRQLRTLGLLAAAGGEPRHTRAVVLLGGASLGLVGSLVGAALGVAAAFPARGAISALAGRLVGPVDVPWGKLVGAIALGTAAATLAAAGPARSAARLSVLRALAERPAEPRRAGRLAAAGLVVAAGGAGVTAWGTAARSDPWLAVGLVVTVCGFLVSIPLLVTWVGRMAGRLPTTLRIAARDVARHGRRTGAALAAATVALALPVGVAGITLSQEALERRSPYLAADQMLLQWWDRPRPWDPALLAALEEIVPGSLLVPTGSAAVTAEPNHRRRRREVLIDGPVHRDEEGEWYRTASLTIAGPELLRALHAEEGVPALLAGKVVGLGPDAVGGGSVAVRFGWRSSEPVMRLPAVEAGAREYKAVSASYVISPERAADLGFRPRWRYPSQYLLRAPRPLTEEQVAQAKELAAGYQGLWAASADDYFYDEAPARAGVTAVATALALAVVGVVVALLGAETRRDRAILVAVGAEPRTRRLVAGGVALVLAALAGALAVPVGFLPVVVFRLAQDRGYPIVPPWATFAVVLVLAPLLAAGLAAAFSRQPKAAQLLRPVM